MHPVYPGDALLSDHIKPMGASVRAAAMALHVPHSRLRTIKKGECGLSADTALRLERDFGGEAQGWLKLQSANELRAAEIAVGGTVAEEVTPLAPAGCLSGRRLLERNRWRKTLSGLKAV